MLKIWTKTTQDLEKLIEDTLDISLVDYKFTDIQEDSQVKILEINSLDDIKDHTDSLCSQRKDIIVISSLTDEQNVLSLINKININFIIGSNSNSFQRELMYCLSTITNDKELRGSFAFQNAKLIASSTIGKTDDIKSEIDRCIDSIDISSFFSSPRDYLKTIANELVMNAVFNAPHGDQGEASHRLKNRSTKFQLKENEEVKLRVLSCNDALIVSVSDNFGTLDFKTIQEKLKRSAQVKKPVREGKGSGLGLYLIYQYSNIVIFNVGLQKSTDVICVIEPTKRYKRYRERITSFFYNEGDSDE